ncbi:MAG: hypothetical protein NVSMB48_13000 [Marmoricola sp.]
MSTSPGAADSAAEDLLGQRLLDRYLVLERIGRGGMATVYRASDEQLGRDVALKVFHPGLTSPEDLQRQEGEVRHLAQLAHPCLVTLYDAISADEQSFLVLEYVRGQDLRTRLRQGPLPPSVVAALGRDVARALAHIHSRGLVHRDVSPGNILLPDHDMPTPHEDGVAAKLTDLGIARVIDAGHITVTGTLIGTAAYLSPEQVRGQPVSAPTDIYSLGLVLLECLTGERAFEGPAMESTVARLARDPDTGAVPPLWRGVIAALTAREPADRPTATEAAAALADPTLSGDPPDTTATLTAPLLDAGQPQETRVLPPPEPGIDDDVTVRVPGSPLRESAAFVWLRSVPTPWIVLAAAGFILLVVVAWMLASTGGPRATAPAAPTYPTVPGQLGVHLKQLQGEVAPN